MTPVSVRYHAVGLTGPQAVALLAVGHAHAVVRVSGGYAARGVVGRIQTKTVDALIGKGLIEIATYGGGLVVTPAGRARLAEMEGRR